MLAAWLLVGLLAIPVSSLLLFSPLARRATTGWATAPVAVAVVGVAVGVAIALGTVLVYALTAGAVACAAVLVWIPLTRPWGAVGRVAWGIAVAAGAFYVAYMLEWTFRSHLGPVGTVGGLLLCGLEVLAYLLGLAYLWEMVDVLATAQWARRHEPDVAVGATGEVPFVSLHVPAHNEPPDMVIETLTSLLALDYPADRLEIIMIDDNTADPALWQPVADFVGRHPGRIEFHHLEDWPGFKSGALNYALTVTDPRAEVIGVIDADYLAQPEYLRRCAPIFRAEADLGFVQTPQDYRDWEQASYYRRLYHSYSYFFAVSQASRNERNGAIFGGTMGLIRRQALEEVGGWDQWCITEDAELSLRILRAGWSGRHIEDSFGHGIMPLTFDALKRQRFRWCFGGIQILRMHWRSLMPWDRHPDNKLSMAQRGSYLSGALQWYGDLLGLAFSAFLVVAIADLGLGGGVVFRRLSGFLLAAIPALTLINMGRAVALLRRSTHASWRDALGAFGIWLALGWTVANASVRGAIAPAGVFLRTPKTRGDASWSDALKANRVEAAFGAIGLAAIVLAAVATHGATRWLLPALLVTPVLGQLAAPINTVAALRAELPDALRRRRRTERLRAWATGPLRPNRVLAGAAIGIVGLGISFLVLTPTVAPSTTPNLLHEARGHGPVHVVQTPSSPAPAAPAKPPGAAHSTSTSTSRPSTSTTRGGTPTSTTLAPTVANASATTSTTPVSTAAVSTTTTTRPGATPTTVTTGPPTSTPGTTPTTPGTGPPTSVPRTTPTTRPHP